MPQSGSPLALCRNQKNRSILMTGTLWPRIAVGAAVLAAAVRIDAVAKRNIGAVVFGDDGPGLVNQKLSLPPFEGRRQFVRRKVIALGLDVNASEAVGGPQIRPPPANTRIRGQVCHRSSSPPITHTANRRDFFRCE
jgi:hypothetical protein